jgi:hypothetical protein
MAIEDFSSLNLTFRVLPEILQTPRMVFVGFKNEQVSKNELFLHSFEPVYESSIAFFNKTEENPIFSILKKEIIENDGDTVYEFQSVEEYDVVSAANFGSDDEFETVELGNISITTRGLVYSEEELEGLVYAKPIELQINLDEEITTAQKNYVNSIQAPEIEFDVLSSLGSIISEEAITDTTTTGTTTSLATTTETITDVGGATATGERTFTAFDTSGNDDTSTATIRGGY